MGATPLQPLQAADPRRVLVIEDHAVVRHALEALVNGEAPLFACVGAAADVSSGLRMAGDTQPHWIILDAHLGGDDGIALIPTLRSLANCEVIVLSSLMDDALTAYAMRLGASACIHKVAPVEDLLLAMSATAATH
jgi:two-component system, NarL family, nitrate/nitrite response regulator NarL